MVRTSVLLAAAALVPTVVNAATLYSDNFNTDSSANYTVTVTAGATGPSSDATFAYDYSAMGIPAAPNNAAGDTSTTGLRLRVDDLQASVAPAAVGAISLSLASVGYTLPTTGGYTLRADIWGNYYNPSTGGSNTTTGVGVGILGSGSQSPNGGAGYFAGAIHDGQNTIDYRAYANGVRRAGTTGDYAAGLTDANTNNTDPYYSNSSVLAGGKSAPAAQQSTTTFGTNANTATTTPNGIMGFAWHTFYVQNDGTNITFYIDSLKIATTPVSAITTPGSNISIDGFDTGLAGAYAAPYTTFNFDIIDNLVLETGLTAPTPEPTSLALLGFAGAGLLARRRRA